MINDTHKSAVITDHPFKPRLGKDLQDQLHITPPHKELGPSPYLCEICRLAPAAHRETTVEE